MLFTILRCRCSGGKVVSTKVSCTTPTRCGIATDTKESLNIDALLDKYSLKGGKLEDTAGDKSLRYTEGEVEIFGYGQGQGTTVCNRADISISTE